MAQLLKRGLERVMALAVSSLFGGSAMTPYACVFHHACAHAA
jgi:hypothetical protein